MAAVAAATGVTLICNVGVSSNRCRSGPSLLALLTPASIIPCLPPQGIALGVPSPPLGGAPPYRRGGGSPPPTEGGCPPPHLLPARGGRGVPPAGGKHPPHGGGRAAPATGVYCPARCLPGDVTPPSCPSLQQSSGREPSPVLGPRRHQVRFYSPSF